MLTMYPGMVNSPITELAAAIDETQTTIEVIDGTKLPDAPNLAMIGLGEDTETILYTEKTGNILSGVTRGFQGVAKAWGQGARIARFFTEYDQRAMMQNIQENADNLAAHLNETVTDGVHGLATTQPVALYVDANNGDDTNDGKTPQTAYKTIQKAVSSLPKFIEHLVTINVAPGDYSNEDVLISGFVGKGTIQLLGDASISNTRVVGRIFPANSTINIYVRGFRCLGISKAGVQASYCESVTFEYLNIDNQDSESGILANVSRIFVRNSAISNRGIAINAGNLSQVLSVNNTGTNNSTALRAHASIIRKEGTQPSGTINDELTLSGGLILGGSAAAIVETGSNANGTYVRWSNGMQICYYGATFDLGASELLQFTWTYPAAFVVIPIKLAGSGLAGTAVENIQYGYNYQSVVNTNTQTEFLIKNLHTSQSTVGLGLTAIGRWK